MKESEQKNETPFIFIANHEKWIDSWFIFEAIQQLKLSHTLRPMLSRNLAKSPLGKAYMAAGAFGQDLEEAEQHLNNGHSVLIYPQGRPKEGVKETKSGARELSIKTGIPIIPMLIKAPILNAKRIFLERHEVKVKVGEPFIPQENEDVMDKVWKLDES